MGSRISAPFSTLRSDKGVGLSGGGGGGEEGGRGGGGGGEEEEEEEVVEEAKEEWRWKAKIKGGTEEDRGMEECGEEMRE